MHGHISQVFQIYVLFHLFFVGHDQIHLPYTPRFHEIVWTTNNNMRHTHWHGDFSKVLVAISLKLRFD